ncbi:MAG: FtsW/RodA/SpoVE family cell cycle protein [Chloroflexota bacterium]|nr:FtsW/RodA/SpoVE family cell cycle protein [Chloroflexota bacterium]MDE2936812.1 FtsW/RodA/SpoVE family cell cycle protein [Chloroflexota bacterium]
MRLARRLAALAARFERRDAILFVGLAGLITASLVALAFLGEPLSAGLSSQVLRQSIFVALGGAAYLAMSRLSYRVWWSLSWTTYALAIILLLAVLLFGVERGGSQRWFLLGEIQFQPSEFAKIALIVTLARFYTRSPLALTTLRGHLLAGLITLPLALLVLRQPDFGSAMLLLCIWQGIALAAGVAWRRLVIPPLVTLALSPLIWLTLQPYMRERILSFFDPGFDPLGSGYNVLQARIAIGSGGLWGRGFSESSQTVLEFLRVRETDFIFAVIAEQAGLIGATALLAMFGLVILYCLMASLSAQDSFGGLIAAGVMLIFVFQVVINVGMNAGVVPVTGLTLPLVSAGGSSVLALLAGLGLVTSVSHYREPSYVQSRKRPAIGDVGE